MLFFFFFFNATSTTEIYTLSLHDALPIYSSGKRRVPARENVRPVQECSRAPYRIREKQMHRDRAHRTNRRSEEHTSELQSRRDLVCRLLLEKKKKKKAKYNYIRIQNKTK